jgi:hypothetical protein
VASNFAAEAVPLEMEVAVSPATADVISALTVPVFVSAVVLVVGAFLVAAVRGSSFRHPSCLLCMLR